MEPTRVNIKRDAVIVTYFQSNRMIGDWLLIFDLYGAFSTSLTFIRV
jgi:hypothetical protein